jgi:hypothetical protein
LISERDIIFLEKKNVESTPLKVPYQVDFQEESVIFKSEGIEWWFEMAGVVALRALWFFKGIMSSVKEAS